MISNFLEFDRLNCIFQFYYIQLEFEIYPGNMNLAKLYPDVNFKQCALLNTDISLVNVILSVQVLKMLTDLLLKVILHVIGSYVLMTIFQYLLLALIVVWHIEYLPKLELKHIHDSTSQFVSVFIKHKEQKSVKEVYPSTKSIQCECYPKFVSISHPKSKVLAQCDKISNVSTCGLSCSDTEIGPSDQNVDTPSDLFPTEDFTQVASTTSLLPEALVSTESDNRSIEQSGESAVWRDLCTENMNEIDNGLSNLNKTLQSMEMNLKCVSTKIRELDNKVVIHSDGDDKRSQSDTSRNLTTSCHKLPSRISGDQDIGDVLLPDKASAQVGHVDGHKSCPVSISPADLNYLSSIITKFDGDKSRYQAFKYRFCTLSSSMDLTDTDKGLLLYLSLEENVTNCLGDFLEDGRVSYRKLWNELDYEFDPPQQGRFSQVAALFSINSMSTCDTLDKLVKLYKFAKRHYIALDRIGAGSEIEGFKMSLLSKLCGDVADNVARYMNEMGERSTVPAILDIVKQEISNLEILQIADSLHKEVPSSNNQESHSPPAYTDSHCMFCMADGHDSSNCKRYRNPKDYHNFVFRHNLCFNCLQYGHKSYDCTLPSQCDLCVDRRKHSTVLCSHYHSHDSRGSRY